jgi:hypothetical protein
MKKAYEMITLKNYIETYDVEYSNPPEKDIQKQLEKYLLSKQRNETNAKIIEALLA